jgi:uncharacterized protein YjbI with pentapeptide repeats
VLSDLLFAQAVLSDLLLAQAVLSDLLLAQAVLSDADMPVGGTRGPPKKILN